MSGGHRRGPRFATILLAGTACLVAGAATGARAQTAPDETPATEADPVEIEEILVTGSRLPANITSVPGTVTIVDSVDLAEQAAISSDLGRILASTVPGFGPSANDGNNFAQTLRGRKPSYFIDGVPQSAELRGGGRDLRIIHPSVLDRVEVINGATSIYGLGGSGGVVNYITRRPRGQGVNWFTEGSFSGSLSELRTDNLEVSFTQTVMGRHGDIDFVGSLTYQDRGLYYDANGEPIAPDPTGQTGLADMTEISVFGRVGVNISNTVRWETTVVLYDAEVDTDYTVRQGSFAGGVISTAERKRPNNICIGAVCVDFIGQEDPSAYNYFASTALTFEDVMGSDIQVRLYGKESENVWRHIGFIPLAPTLGGFPPNGSQLVTRDNRYGARVDIATPINFEFLQGDLLWGVEYSENTIEEHLLDGRPRTSDITQQNTAAFVQLQADILPWLHLRTGLRFDDFSLDIPSFMAIDYFSAAKLHTVLGTTLDYDSTTGNFGLVADVTDNLSVFGAWSSGFSIGNVVRTVSGLRPSTNVPAQTYNLAALGQLTEPVQVDSYELGVRYNSEWFTGSLTLYRNESELGATFDPITLRVRRAPEQIDGFEATAEVRPMPSLRIGGSYAQSDTQVDTNNDGAWDGPLDFGRAPPPLLNTYVEYDINQDWMMRIQTASVMSESRFSAPFGQLQRDIDSYTIVDLVVSGEIGPGRLSLGVENLFNNDYVPMATLMNCSDNVFIDSFCNTAPPGARGTIRYSVSY